MWRKSYVEYSIFAVKNLRVSKSNTDTWQKTHFRASSPLQPSEQLS